MALPSLLHNKLRQILLDDGPFDSNEELRGVFADPRLIQWRHSIPEASNRASRVNFTIAKLLDDWNANGENALYLFLVVVSEQTGKSSFADLAEDVKVGTIQGKINACQQELKQIAEHLTRGWSDPAYAASRRAKVEEDLQQWQARLAQKPELMMLPAESASTRDRTVVATSSVVTANGGEDETYTDIEIHIFGKVNDVYPVSAKLSSGASFAGELQLDEAALLVNEADSERYGELLSRALFVGDIDKAYLIAETLAEAMTEGRLRLRLWIDNSAAELQALRWEHLCYWREKTPFRLATAADRPFSRYFGLGRADPEPLIPTPIRILVVVANPRNLADYNLMGLNVEGEIANLLDTFSPFLDSGISLTILPGQTVFSSELNQRMVASGCRLESGPASHDVVIDLLASGSGYHVLYFLGHGTYNSRRKQAALYCEDQVGNVQIVLDKGFVEGLHDAGNIPHLIFLAACESAKRETNDLNPFIGLAPKLIQIGVPAVVAMQDSISIVQAQRLTTHFFKFLLVHGLVDKAMNQARAAITRYNSNDGAIPVLFTRLQNGRLLRSFSNKE